MNAERFVHKRLTDAELLAEVKRLAASERTSTVRLIAALGELDARRLYLGEGCASLFVYCTRVLHLSEHAAYGRIEAARAARRFPILLDMLESGELTLTSISLLAPHLEQHSCQRVLEAARHRTKREVEEIVAALRPQADVPTRIRKQPAEEAAAAWAHAVAASNSTAMKQSANVDETAGGTEAQTPASAPSVATAASSVSRRDNSVVQPLARYKLQLTISAETRVKLQRVQDLMRHSLPSGDLATILERALDLLLKDLERARIAAAVRPREGQEARPGSRRIPAAVRRSVWQRDGSRCAFLGPHHRCGETAFLEFHHVRPFAAGGQATAENIELRCRAHNQYEADLFFTEPADGQLDD